MIRRLMMLGVLSLMVWFMTLLEEQQVTSRDGDPSFMLGFILLSAYLAGLLCDSLSLPRITGYLLIGVLFGPDLFGFLDEAVQANMNVFVQMAFAFIGLAAGAELRIAELRQRARSVLFLILGTTFVVGIGVTLAGLLFHSMIPVMAGRPLMQVLAMCSLIGVVAIARSPSSTIAIINETRSKGPFTETILGVAMSVDMIILPLFSIVAALALLTFSPQASFDIIFILTLCIEILASVVVGVGVGILLAMYIRRRGPQLSLIVLGICFLVFRGSEELGHYLEQTHAIVIHAEPLLICAAIGFAVQNFSRQGRRLLTAMGKVDLPVYIVFFTMAGAALSLDALGEVWVIAVGLMVIRVIVMFVGSGLAGRLAGDPPDFIRYSWLGFLSQAGLSIALATQLATSFGAWGQQLASLLIASIALNQVLGPVAFKYALDKVGETRNAKLERARKTRSDGKGSEVTVAPGPISTSMPLA